MEKFKTHKIIIASLVIIVVILTAIKVVNTYLELKMYKEVVANSYEPDEDLEIYVEKFYRDLEYYGIFPMRPRIKKIKFSNLDQLKKTTHIHAISYGINDDERIEIYINPNSWRQFSKPKRYFLMYHELAHDVLNLDDLSDKPSNIGKLMYPEISTYQNITMDDFIESYHTLFEEYEASNK